MTSEAPSHSESIPESDAFGRIRETISKLISPAGYEVVHFEIQTHRVKVLRVFIDHLPPLEKGIGVEDCAQVSRLLDEPLDLSPELNAIFHGTPYELEVSSPGVDRPLRQPQDFSRFAGHEVRIHTFRALTESEIGDPNYWARNAKQKHFVGRLVTLEGSGESLRVRLAPKTEADSKGKARRKAPQKAQKSNGAQLTGPCEITIPFSLVSKANLEPNFEILDGESTGGENPSH